MRPFSGATWQEVMAPGPVPADLPLVALRDGVIFPEQRASLAIGRPASLAAIEAARATPGHHVLVVAQREAAVDEPGLAALHEVGCVARVFGESQQDFFLLGVSRARVLGVAQGMASTTPLLDVPAVDERGVLREVAARTLDYAWQDSLADARRVVAGIPEDGRVADLILGAFALPLEQKQFWLAQTDVAARIRFVQGGERDLESCVPKGWLARRRRRKALGQFGPW